jgi:membrane protease YdiL (CAAX protease family)
MTQQKGESTLELLKDGFDFSRIKSSQWRIGVFVLMPFAVLLSYGLIVVSGAHPSAQWTPIFALPLFLMIYGISAYCEEIGWTAIMTNGLLKRFSIVKTGLITGIVWATWHIIPYVQTHNTTNWIIWQCIFTIIFRVLMTKIYVITNRSVFAVTALHATYNIAFSLMPYYGSSYNPMYMSIATLFVCILLFITKK